MAGVAALRAFARRPGRPRGNPARRAALRLRGDEPAKPGAAAGRRGQSRHAVRARGRGPVGREGRPDRTGLRRLPRGRGHARGGGALPGLRPGARGGRSPWRGESTPAGRSGRRPAPRSREPGRAGARRLCRPPVPGLPIAADDERLAPSRERGRALWRLRQGQLNLSCAQCHDDHWGRRLGGAPIPQGHPTGYPLYRLEWQSLGSLGRRLRNCLTGARAEPFPAGSPELVDLEVYLAWRARGLAIETPAVRP
jgi:hypothetical protein